MSVGAAVVVVDDLNHLRGFPEVGSVDALQLGNGAADVEPGRVEKFSHLGEKF